MNKRSGLIFIGVFIIFFLFLWNNEALGNSGDLMWASDGVAICTATNTQEYHKIISDGNGGAIVTWQDYRSGNYGTYTGNNTDIYAQRVDINGNTQWAANGVSICTATNDQVYPQIIYDGSGGAIITWRDYRSGNYDIYAQRVGSIGNIGVNNPNTVCYFAEGCTASGFDTWFLIMNPNTYGSANVTLTFMDSEGKMTQEEVTVPAGSRYTIRANDIIRNSHFGTKIESDANIVVERSMYWDSGDINWAGGHNSMGI